MEISKYIVEEEIGRGTCGVVHRAFDPFINRYVALKVALSKSTINKEGTQKFSNTFFQEAHAAGKLAHPNIVSLYDAGYQDNFYYIVMEYIKGNTVLDVIKGNKLSLEAKVQIIFQCCKALEYAHSEGVIHRDIKPSNIMLTEKGNVKIMDFSIASLLEGDSVNPDSILGSPSYMSPEQIQGKTLKPKTDQFSLGVVAYHLFSGARPFTDENVAEVLQKVLKLDPPMLHEVSPKIPKAISVIINKAMSKNEADRFDSCDEFAAALMKSYDALREQERSIAKIENRNTLSNLDFFRNFSQDEIDEIITKSEFVNFVKGDVIIQEGDIDRTFYIITRGEVNIQKDNATIAELQQGDCFGEVSMLMGNKRTASVIAKEDLLVMKLSSLSIESLSERTQLNYYKTFNETLLYRLSMTNARLSAAKHDN